jgi:hypothetical protein
MTEQNKAQKQKKNTTWIYWVALAVLLILLIIAGVFWQRERTEVESLVAEKEQIRSDLQSELDTLLTEHAQVKRDYGVLADSLVSQDSIIQANAKEIKQLLNYKWEYFQIKKKLDRLRVVAQGYVYQLDSLYTVNQELREENIRIRENYQTERQRNIGLTREKEELTERVTEAAVLRAYNIQSTGIRQRGSRTTETDKARRTDAIQVCFTIGENPLIPNGKKNIYLRIARPDNVILIYDETDEYTFTHEGNKLQYSLRHEIDYSGAAQDVCVFWNKRNADEKTMDGQYTVSIYSDDALIGSGAFELR